ncbi:MAG: MBL fold metallo-hydrolase [Chloroflexota bacterium]
MNVVNVGYDSTNYYLLDAPAGKLLIDCGWPGTLPKLSAELKRKGIGWNEVRHLLVRSFPPPATATTASRSFWMMVTLSSATCRRVLW